MASHQKRRRKRTTISTNRDACEPLEPRLLLTTYTVTSTADDLTPGTLRQAITDSNANSGADTIAFAIAGDGVHRIVVNTPLPGLNDAVTLDARTQPGFAGSPLIELVGGSALATNVAGLRIAEPTSGTVVRGLAIGGFAAGIDSAGLSVRIATNYIGLAADGTPLPNGVGVRFGGTRIANGVPSSFVGGLAATDMNVISSNREYGVIVTDTASLLICGNRIGTDPSGMTARPNNIGVFVQSRSTVGGGLFGRTNLISGNILEGVRTDTAAAKGFAFIEANLIGTDVTGMHALPNGVGIHVISGDPLIGNHPEGTNTISGNLDQGILDDGGGAQITYNRIGVAINGVTPLGNGGAGIALRARYSSVGGTSTDGANVIAYNGGAGITLTYPMTAPIDGSRLRFNSIHDNVGPGIDLGNDGHTPNDLGDTDTGPNLLQNYPVLTDAATTGGRTYVAGTLDTQPNAKFVIDLYANRAGQTQGERYLGSVNVQTDASGNASFAAWLDAALSTPGESLTATAGGYNIGGSTTTFYGTSEFSTPLTVAADADANRDGRVDFNDLVPLAQHYNTPASSVADGDFNRDGNVDFNDLVLLAQAYNTGAAGVAAPPIPALLTTSAKTKKPATASPPVFSTTPVRRPAPPTPHKPAPRR